MSHSRFKQMIADNQHWSDSKATSTAPYASAGAQTEAARAFAGQLRTLRESKDQVATAEAMKQTMLAMRSGAPTEPSIDPLADDERLCAVLDAQFGSANSCIMNVRVDNRRPGAASEAHQTTDAQLAADMDRVFGPATRSNVISR